MRIDKQRIKAFLKSSALPLLIGVPLLLLLLVFWSVQQDSVNSLKQQITDLKQQIDALPATVVPKDKLALKKDQLTLEKDRVNAQNAIYVALAQAIGGVFFVVTAYFTWRNLKVAEENLKATQERQATDRSIAEANLRVTEEMQLTERFSKAIELLGSGKLEVRLGGIYALERIAKDSPKDHWTIMEVLISFVQEKSPLSQNIQQEEKLKITTDVQAVLTVIGRRGFNKEQDGQRIELPRTKLRGANLTNANLANADLTNTDLTEANLANADLTNTDLTEANLTDVNLTRATLTNVNLTRANLTRTNWTDADHSEADFTEVYSNEARDKYTEEVVNPYELELLDLYEAEEAQAREEINEYYYNNEAKFLSKDFQQEENKLLKNRISKAKGKPKLPDYLQ